MNIAQHLSGLWKRTLEWREFGGPFSFVRTTNTVVLVEMVPPATSDAPAVLRWYFGSSPRKSDLRLGYSMEVFITSSGGDARFQWEYGGSRCVGQYCAATGVVHLPFLQRNSSLFVTLRLLDPETIAVSILEAETGNTGLVQMGNMFRLDPSLYPSQPQK